MKGAGGCISMPSLDTDTNEICIPTKNFDKYEDMVIYEVLRFTLEQIGYYDLYTIDTDVYYTVVQHPYDTTELICTKLNDFMKIKINIHTFEITKITQSILYKRLATFNKIRETIPFTFNGDIIILNFERPHTQINVIKIVKTEIVPKSGIKFMDMEQIYKKKPLSTWLKQFIWVGRI